MGLSTLGFDASSHTLLLKKHAPIARTLLNSMRYVSVQAWSRI